MGFSFIHTSDIHLGRPFSDLDVLSEKIALCNQACQKSFDNIVNFAISRQVDFVLIAGDSFDNDEHDLSTKLLFIKNLEKLADNGIKSYVICGNHDPVELYKKYGSYFKFDKKYDGIINITGVTTENSCNVYSYNNCVNIHALSFDSDECSNPVSILKQTSCNDEMFNIGLIHCDIDKTESKYGPCSRQELQSLGYDYYALGHIHVPDFKDGNIVYAGSPQGRTKKETGQHGFCYIEAEGKNILKKEFIPSDYVRFSSLDLDCMNLNNRKEVFDEIISLLNQQPEDVDLSLFEINLTGVSGAYEDLAESDNLLSEYIENYLNEEPQKASVFRINNYTVPDTDEEELLKEGGIIGLLAGSFSSETADIDAIYNNIADIHSNIYKKSGISSVLKNELINHIEEDKEEILKLAEKETMALCKEIYNMD